MSAVGYNWLLSHCFDLQLAIDLVGFRLIMQHYEILTSVLMPSEFERCAGDSPFCLGMVEYHCCGIEMEKHSSDKEAFQSDNPAK